MVFTSRTPRLWTSALDRFRRPAGIADSTRWLFLWLTVLSIVLALPAALTQSHGPVKLMAIAAALTLITSWTYSYLTRSALLVLDVVDAIAIMAFALACTNPAAAYPALFAAIWFRALYGSTRRSLIRAVLYIACVSATVPLWTSIPGHTSAVDPIQLIVSFPLVFVTVVVGRQLGGALEARERTLRRDGLLATTGSLLLGKTDAAEIRRIGSGALTEICAATPGLVLMNVHQVQSVLHVVDVTDGFIALPDTLPGAVLTSVRDTGIPQIGDKGPLNAAVDTPLNWACVAASPPYDWLLVGAPKRVLTEAVLAVRGLTNQVTLPLHNSDTHQELSTRARFDATTGLANRATFITELAFRLQNHPAETVHALFLDLDHFKAVNDVLGHAAGDDVLIEIANRLRACVRPSDLCARLGGDEFG